MFEMTLSDVSSGIGARGEWEFSKRGESDSFHGEIVWVAIPCARQGLTLTIASVS